MHTPFASAAAAASGVRAALDLKGSPNTNVVAWAGDGGTFDIGLQALSGAAERNEDFIYFCYDNEAYMNTGVQRSSATPWGAWTTTTPTSDPEHQPKKDIMAIMAAHRIPYAATASVAYPVDLVEKVKKARTIRGTRFIHILAPCPPGWKTQNDETIDLPAAGSGERRRLAIHGRPPRWLGQGVHPTPGALQAPHRRAGGTDPGRGGGAVGDPLEAGQARDVSAARFPVRFRGPPGGR
jgi:hypothetical protein